MTRRARGDGGPHWVSNGTNGTGDQGGGHPNDRPGAVHAANKRRNRMTPEAFRRVAEIARAHPKGQGARVTPSSRMMPIARSRTPLI